MIAIRRMLLDDRLSERMEKITILLSARRRAHVVSHHNPQIPIKSNARARLPGLGRAERLRKDNAPHFGHHIRPDASCSVCVKVLKCTILKRLISSEILKPRLCDHADTCTSKNRVRGPYVVVPTAANDVADVVPGGHHLQGKDSFLFRICIEILLNG